MEHLFHSPPRLSMLVALLGVGNLTSITARFASHTKSLFSVISCGMARNHRGNPAASLRVESCYSAPKLFSGLASLLLSPAEI